MLDLLRSTSVARRLSAMSQDPALLLALILAGAGPLLATAVGLPTEGQIVLACVAFLFMARAIRLVTPVAFVVAALVGLALAPFIEPSQDTAELIVVAIVFVCVAPAAVLDVRTWRRRLL
jgi:hypothetical protein